MKTEYIVCFIDPFSRKVRYFFAKELDEVQRILDKNGKKLTDYVIIRKDIDNEGVESFKLEKNGYGMTYVILNKLFMLFTFMLLLLFSYLYYKFFNK